MKEKLVQKEADERMGKLQYQNAFFNELTKTPEQFSPHFDYETVNEALQLPELKHFTPQGKDAFLQASPDILDVVSMPDKENITFNHNLCHFLNFTNSLYFPDEHKIILYKTPFPETGNGLDAVAYETLNSIFFRGLTDSERDKLCRNLILLLKEQQVKQDQKLYNFLDFNFFSNHGLTLEDKIYNKFCSKQDFKRLIREIVIEDNKFPPPLNIVSPEAFFDILSKIHALVGVEVFELLPRELEDHYAQYFTNRRHLSHSALAAFKVRTINESPQMKNIRHLSLEISKYISEISEADIAKYNLKQKFASLKNYLHGLNSHFEKLENSLVKEQVKYLLSWSTFLHNFISQQSFNSTKFDKIEDLSDDDSVLIDKLNKLYKELDIIYINRSTFESQEPGSKFTKKKKASKNIWWADGY